ncbi:hypothetical protein AN214_01632 [Pseudoalteromonas sp. P1-9]|nr:hypothetical protein AN214_01632 [Pseudoalteromonas sp. P1-9]
MPNSKRIKGQNNLAFLICFALCQDKFSFRVDDSGELNTQLMGIIFIILEQRVKKYFLAMLNISSTMIAKRLIKIGIV